MLLAIDLSTAQGHIALFHSGQVLYERQFTSHRSHNSMLYEPLAEALKLAGDGLRGIVIGTGPGSYTGVRISIAAAQGIGLSRDVPVVGWSSLASLSSLSKFFVIGDARRGQSYVGSVVSGQIEGELRLLDEAATREWLEAHIGSPLFTSDDAAPLGSDQVQCTKPSAILLAQHVAGLSDEAWKSLISQPDLEPSYLEAAFVTKAKRPYAASATA